ncbi:HXXEE domain-containing protein [Brevibacterium celere]|uniref:HXXEE domain-containing protein n=1 Tax=Brevibacterium TaxID=1696 RepID=UPI003D160500
MALFSAWVIHDIEEALAFPAMCERLAGRTGVDALRMTAPQSWAAVTMMGGLVAAACLRGAQIGGRSTVYRALVAGLEGHVATHLGASILQRGYTAGVATALPVMLPGALVARRELEREGRALQLRDSVNGVAMLLPAAVGCHVIARSRRRTPEPSS